MRFHIAKVPASEIEFTTYKRPIVPNFEATLTGPAAAAAPEGSMFPAFANLKAGDPVPITFKVRNINGADQALPSLLVPPSEDGKTFPAGLTMVLLRNEKVQQAETFFRGGGDEGDWVPVPVPVPAKNQGPRPPGEGPVPVVGPNEDHTICTLDLRDLFDVSQPGTYRLYVTADPKTPPPEFFDSVFFTVTKTEK